MSPAEPNRPVRTYRDLRPTFADRESWTTARVLAHRAQSHGDAIYLDCPEEGRTWTYREIFEAACRVAATLSSGGGPGERLLVMLPNSSMFIRTWLGSQVAGMVEVPINTSYRGQFLEHQVSTVRPKLAVIDGSYAERFVESRAACESIQRFWVAGPDAATGIATLRDAGWEAELWNTLEASEPVEPVEASPRDLASIFFTSGTTGPSKGVMMPQAQMYFFADECVSLTRLTDADTYMITTPLFHGNAQFLAAYPALVAGARFVLHSHFSASRWIDQIRDCGATVTNFLGVMMDFVWKQPPRPDDAGNDLRCIFAAPTAYSIIDEFKARFGVDAFVEVFGLTETSMPILSPYGEDRPPGAAGLAVEDWFDVRLVDPETDEEVPTGELGELVIRTKYPWTCSMGYYNMPDKTAEAWRNLWFHTGDGLRRDADGWYYFVDRLKDALRRRGENISSYEVEQALLGHPDIAECAVVAVEADIEAGEDEVMAWLVTSGPIDMTELWAWADTRMPAFAVPRFIEVVDELPKTPSERVQKIKLRERGVSPTTHDRTKTG
ncbi:AMP-binding protein [Candidatus Poriferisocius sp.]|uniref:AMP-binding protein n=1 Tax=Candidatus Poriferisocius sp. TaxID=3101276 RepID=UPI003B02B785